MGELPGEKDVLSSEEGVEKMLDRQTQPMPTLRGQMARVIGDQGAETAEMLLEEKVLTVG